MEKLAIDGGAPVRTTPLPTVNQAAGRRIGQEEVDAVTAVLKSGQLNCTIGSETASWEEAFAERYGVGYAAAASSGTAALHMAIAAVDPEPGDEIITTPITDAGSVLPIVAQNAVPIFADVDRDTGQLDPDSVESLITPRTKAIVVVHLMGYPGPVHELRELADRHGIALIEDCAQALLAETDRGVLVGTIGNLGCFSLQQSKHITSGDGGIVITDDNELGRRARLFADKGWPRDTKERTHLFLGLNYRMTELQAAVARTQLTKLDDIVADRRRTATQLAEVAGELEGITTPAAEGSSFWMLPLFIDPLSAGADGRRYAQLLNAEGISANAGYLQRPVYSTPFLAEHLTYGTSGYPLTGRKYSQGLCPRAEELISGRMVVIPWNENYTDQDVADCSAAVRKVHQHFLQQP